MSACPSSDSRREPADEAGLGFNRLVNKDGRKICPAGATVACHILQEGARLGMPWVLDLLTFYKKDQKRYFYEERF